MTESIKNKKSQDNYEEEFDNGRPNWAVLIPILLVMAGIIVLALLI